MKKIIGLLIIFTFITSCTNNTEEKVIEVKNTNTEVEQTIEDIMKEEIKVESETKTEEPSNDKKPIINEVEKNDTNENPTEVNTDEASLESEVNDLLDEFIDSLDSYDK